MIDLVRTLLARRPNDTSTGLDARLSVDPMQQAWLAEDLGLSPDRIARIGDADRSARHARGEGSRPARATVRPVPAELVREVAAVCARGSAPVRVAPVQLALVPEDPALYGPAAAVTRRG